MGNFLKLPKIAFLMGYAVVLGFAFFLLFFRLDNHLLWGDEAETAVLAKNVVQFGVPQTLDGTNYIVLHGPVDETQDHVWIWSPWLQEYLTASSFIIFGPTTWAARAPFALIGWLSLVALALIAYKIYRNHWVSLASMVLLGTSEIFLLHARQCRYYSVSVFCEVLLVFGIWQLLNQNRRGVWLAALALVLQFYSNYIIAAANLPALFFVSWLLRKQGWRATLWVGEVLAILAVAALPWLIYAHPWNQSAAVGGESYLKKAVGYLTEFHFHFLPLCFLLLPLLGWVKNRNETQPGEETVPRQWEQFVLGLMLSYLAVILVAPGFYLRYLLPVLPVACLLAAAWVFRYIKWRALAVLVVVIQSTSNIFSISTAFPFREMHALRWPLKEYVDGLSTPYADRFADVLDFFKTHARPGEKLLSFDPEFPLIFYTPLGIIDGRIMVPAQGHLPGWILPASASGIVPPDAFALPEFLQTHYDKMIIEVHDSIRGDNVPEPDIYQYQSTQARAPFIIYKLKPEPDGGKS